MKKASDSSLAPLATNAARRIRQRKRPVQSRSRATVDAILEATAVVLSRRGMAKLTTTEVARRAGVSVGTLYQYFPDKESLVMALKLAYVERLVGAVTEAARGASGRPLAIAVPAMLRALVDAKRENLELTLAIRAAMADGGGDRIAREATATLVSATRDLLVAGRPGIRNADLAARVVVSAIEGTMTLGLYEDPALLASDEFFDEIVALVLGYLEHRSGRDARTVTTKRRGPDARV